MEPGSGSGRVTATEFHEATQAMVASMDELARQIRRSRRAGNDNAQAIIDKLDAVIAAIEASGGGKPPKPK